MAATHLRLGGLARSVTHGAWVQGQQAERCMDEQSRQEAEGVQGMSCGVARCMGWWFWRGRRAEGAAASRLGKRARAQAGRCIVGARGGAAWGRGQRLAGPRSAENGGAEGCVHAACQGGCGEKTRAGRASEIRFRQGSGDKRRRNDTSCAGAGERREDAGSGLLGRGASGNEAVAMQKAWDGGSGGADARRLLQQAD